MAGLSLKVVIGDLDIPQLELQCPVCVAESSNLLFQGILRPVGFGLGFFAFFLSHCQQSHS